MKNYSRRTFLALTSATVVALSGCSGQAQPEGSGQEQSGGSEQGAEVVNKSKLKELLQTQLDSSQYTQESWQDYIEAKNDASDVYYDDSATQEDVDEAVEDLQDAIDSLEEQRGEQKLTIVESGYYVDDGYVMCAYTIHNESFDHMCIFPTINVVGRDSDGGIVFSEDLVLSFICANGTYTVSDMVGDGTAPDTVEFISRGGDWTRNTDQYDGMYTFDNLNVVGDGWSTHFTGEMTVNETLPDVTGVWVSVVFRDGDGNLMGGTIPGFVDNVERGETYPVDVDTIGTLPDYSTFEMHGIPW